MFERDNDRHGRGRLRTALAIAAVTAVVASMAIVGTVAAQPGQRFSDVPRTHYAYTSIEWAVENGITQGCGDGRNFCPADTLNRAQMVTFLKRYHDKFHGTTADDSDDSSDLDEYMLSGIGTDEERVSLPAGRYRVELDLLHTGPIQTDFDKVTLTVEDSDGRTETPIEVDTTSGGGFSATAKSLTSRANIIVGDRLGDLDPGRIYFKVTIEQKTPGSNAILSAEWEIIITER